MWKATLLFGVHRVCLLLVAAFAIQKSQFLSHGWSLPKIKSAGEVLQLGLKRVSEFPEYRALTLIRQRPVKEVFQLTNQPMVWISRIGEGITGLSSYFFFALLSNLFFYLFLLELFSLINRMMPQDTAESTVILAVLWPSSFVLNFGSSLALQCFLTVYSLRTALDSRWLLSGTSVAFLALGDPFGIGIVPLLLLIFWSFERHLTPKAVFQRSVLFLIPLVILSIVQWPSYRQFWIWLRNSGFLNAYFYSVHKGSVAWAFSESMVGQTLSAFFVMVGAVVAMISHATWIHRVIPVYLGLAMLILSPYGSLATRALLASVAFEGIATLSARPLHRIVNLGLTYFGAYNIYRVFLLS